MLHSLVCMFFNLTSLALFIYGLVRKEDPRYLWAFGLGSYFLFPILTECLINIKAAIRRTSLNQHDCSIHSTHCPIIYSDSYNITACGLERCHPFDSIKYGRIFRFLLEKGVISKATKIHSPQIPSREFLTEVVSKWYLFKLNYSLYVCKNLEVPLFFLPAFFLRMRVLDPMAKASKGSVDAACTALHHGWAINLAGGYHHACSY